MEKKLRLGIGCDHAGFTYKEELVKMLRVEGYEVTDFGTNSEQSVDYPDYVHPLCDAVEAGKDEFGILLCGSANGMAITANKHQHIRAAICWDNELASLARRHNNANVICLPARFVALQLAKEMVNTFLHTSFEGGRHERRVEKIPINV